MCYCGRCIWFLPHGLLGYFSGCNFLWGTWKALAHFSHLKSRRHSPTHWMRLNPATCQAEENAHPSHNIVHTGVFCCPTLQECLAQADATTEAASSSSSSSGAATNTPVPPPSSGSSTAAPAAVSTAASVQPTVHLAGEEQEGTTATQAAAQVELVAVPVSLAERLGRLQAAQQEWRERVLKVGESSGWVGGWVAGGWAGG